MFKNLLIFLSLLSLNMIHAETERPISVIVDTDMGDDDIMALLSLLAKPNIEVKAITVCGTGLAHAKEGHSNVRKLLHFVNKEIPSAFGRELPAEGGHPFPEAWRTKSDSYLDFISVDDCEPCDRTAVELLRDTIASSAEKITLLALGPLTNIAELFKTHPETKNNIEKIHIMGGAVDVPGNVAGLGNEVAEWNIFADPMAAKEVLQSGLPLYFVALDTTNPATLTPEFFEHVEQTHKTPSADYFFDMLKTIVATKTHKYCFWDLVAVETLAHPDLVHFEPRRIDIITDEGSFCGQTASSADGHFIHLGIQLDAEKFFQTYYNTINN